MSGLQSPLALHSASADELRQRLELAKGGSPFLVLRAPGGPQRLVSLADRSRVTVGRRPDSDVALPWDERVSLLHAELVRIGHDWVLVDDGLSTNGTWIGDQRVSGRRRLRDGDLIRTGGTIVAFCAPDEPRRGTLVADDAADILGVSPAQRRVLVALCRPFLLTGALAPASNADLAQELFLSVDAVKTHLKALFQAFGLDDVPPRQKRAALVERAVKAGTVRERDVASPGS